MIKYIIGFYNSNKFYSKTLGSIICTIVIIDIIILYIIDEPNYSMIGKLWEIASSILTAVYTIWFWKSEKGIDILDSISETKPKNKVKTTNSMWFAILLLVIIVFINFLTLTNNNKWFHFITLVLMIATFSIFTWMDGLIIGNHTNKDVEREFRYLKNHSDIPGIIAFILLGLYFIFLQAHPMELFFSGAIAFQMLFSSFIWANTEITNFKLEK